MSGESPHDNFSDERSSQRRAEAHQGSRMCTSQRLEATDSRKNRIEREGLTLAGLGLSPWSSSTSTAKHFRTLPGAKRLGPSGRGPLGVHVTATSVWRHCARRACLLPPQVSASSLAFRSRRRRPRRRQRPRRCPWTCLCHLVCLCNCWNLDAYTRCSPPTHAASHVRHDLE